MTDTDDKLKLFRALVRSQSPRQIGEQGEKVLLKIYDACQQQNTTLLLTYVDKYLELFSAGDQAIEIQPAPLKREAFNDIRDMVKPILIEINPRRSLPEEKKDPPLSWFQRLIQRKQVKK